MVGPLKKELFCGFPYTLYIFVGENGPMPENPAEVVSSAEACHNLLDVAKQVSEQLANIKVF